jgi:regulator of protease activity HflC (stomatin/prohibitin superfamily)
MRAYPTLEGTPLPPPKKHSRWRRFVERQLPSIVIFLMVITLLAIVLYPYMVVSVPSAQVGVLWKRFGGGTQLERNQLRSEGLHILMPWDKLFLYDLRMQSMTETYHAITRDGVNIGATINVRFQLQRDFVPKLHLIAGPDYLNLLVRPEIGSRVREVIAEFTAEEVYSTKRQEIQNLGRERAKKMMGEMAEREPGEQQKIRLNETLNIYDVLILGIELPAVVVAAINRKIEQYYIAEEYKFRVERERRESERKQIEAVGIRNFQQTVSQGISDSYLRWRGIEATLQLAQSTNSKIVIVGGGKDGLPIILGNVDSPAVTPPAPGGVHHEGEPGARERPTAASPARPLEKTPASGLPEPTEKPPSAGSEQAPLAANVPQSNPRLSWPFSLQDFEKVLSRLVHPQTDPSTEAASSAGQPPAAAPAAKPPSAAAPASGSTAASGTPSTSTGSSGWPNVIPAVPAIR